MAETNSEKIAVLLFSAGTLVRQMITGLLERDHDINVVGQASNRSELMDRISDSTPAIVILHHQPKGNLDTLEAVRLINELASGAKPMVVFEDYDREFELAALETGVRGYLPESKVKADLIRSIKAVYEGQMWVRRAVIGEFVLQLFVKIKRGDYLSPSVHYFTKRELDVILLVNKGLKNKETSKKLFISEKTVKNVISKIFKKLQIKKNRYQEILLIPNRQHEPVPLTPGRVFSLIEPSKYEHIFGSIMKINPATRLLLSTGTSKDRAPLPGI